jgi:hypothetical protein
LDADNNAGDALSQISNVEVSRTKQAYQCDLRRLILNGMSPSFTVDEFGSDRPEYDARKHRRESFAKIPYLLDLD